MTADRSSRLTFAATCAIPIECEHGWDVCPICDAEPVTDPRRADSDVPQEDLVPVTLRFPASLRKRALGVATDEDRTFASLVIYALRRYVDAADRATPREQP